MYEFLNCQCVPVRENFGIVRHDFAMIFARHRFLNTLTVLAFILTGTDELVRA